MRTNKGRSAPRRARVRVATYADDRLGDDAGADERRAVLRVVLLVDHVGNGGGASDDAGANERGAVLGVVLLVDGGGGDGGESHCKESGFGVGEGGSERVK